MSGRRIVGGAVVLGTVAWFVAALVGGPFGRPACAAQAPPPRVDLRVLVVTATAEDAAARAWVEVLTAEGVPHDVSTDPVTPQVLAAPTGAGRYQGVVVATPGVLDDAEQAALGDYQRRFAVRRVDAWVSPGTGAPVPLPPFIERLSETTATLTSEGEAAFPYLQGDVPIEFSFGFVPAPVPGVTALVEDERGRPLVATTEVGGSELLFVVPQTAPGLLHWRLLGPGLVDWVTGGVHLGLYRWWFSMHVDDLFLPNFLWNPAEERTDPDLTVRTTEDDIHVAARWSRDRDFRLDLGFNALGRTAGLCGALLEEKDAFGWFNHTYSHLNMDDLDLDTLTREVLDNVRWAAQQDVDIDSGELVTGAHTGLENPDLPEALRRAGVTRIGSDVTEDPLPRTIGPARTVPRYPTNLYYDAATIEQDLAQFNYRYFTDCVASATTTCRERPATWEDLLATDGRTILGHVLGNDPRPHYAHQSNLTGDRILFPLLDVVLGRYRELVSAPLRQPTLTEASEALERQLAWQSALEAGEVDAWRQGDRLVVRVERPLWVPVTGLATGGERYAGQRSGWVRARPGGRLEIPIA